VTRIQLLALDLPRRAEPESIDDEGMVVLFLALLVRPIVGADVGADDELITLTGIAGQDFTERPEGNKPKRGYEFLCIALLVPPVVITYQQEVCVRQVTWSPLETSSGLRARLPTANIVKQFIWILPDRGWTFSAGRV